MRTAARTKILCVDDETQVLEGLALHLRRKFDVAIASSGAAGLATLQGDPDIAVVLSDMRMPGMDGAKFLSQVRQVAPNTVRILLTGQTDLDSAISAVNDGQIFRFLTKPCAPNALLGAVEAAVEQHRLITAEKVLLEQTLLGSVRVLFDVLSIANPAAFGRATRIKQCAADVAEALGAGSRWQLEVAAMMSQLGLIALPAESVEAIYSGRAPTGEERAAIDKAPALTEQLLSQIPRLEGVREILAMYPRAPSRIATTDDARKQMLVRAAQILRVAVDYDALDAQAVDAATALDTMRGRAGVYDPDVLDALGKVRSAAVMRDEIREVPLSALRVGMVFANDVRTTTGTLLATRGYAITPGFMERVGNFRPGSVREPVRVIVKAARRPHA